MSATSAKLRSKMATPAPKTKLDDYRKRDYRTKCWKCQRWMRYSPTEKTPATRRPPPHASACTDCPRLEVRDGEVYVVHEIPNFN